MGRMEVITRTERRRTYSEAEKAAVVADCATARLEICLGRVQAFRHSHLM